MPLLPLTRLTTLLRVSAATSTLLGLSIAATSQQAHAMSTASTTLPRPSQPPGITPRPYVPTNPPPAPFPYPPSTFTRTDPSPDTAFYSSPRFVTHIDDAAIASLSTYYAHALPRSGRILDFCSSWISHLPPSHEAATGDGDLRVDGYGMSEAELARNEVLSTRVVRDLNETPKVDAPEGGAGAKYDAATCVVSIDYLTNPVSVLESIRSHTKPGGAVHLVVSNRCFPTKAVRGWLGISEEERLEMVGDYLWWSGWREVAVLDLKEAEDKQVIEGQPQSLQGFMGWFGMSAQRDPLWVVRGVNPGESSASA